MRLEHELFGRSPCPPRFEGGENHGERLRIGMAIDWLDSLPGDRDTREVHRARRHCGPANAAVLLTKVPPPPERAIVLEYSGHNNHDSESGAGYHADIVGHLYADELPIASALYTRLRDADPTSLSALANLAELERRMGEIPAARALLEEAFERATTSSGTRHGVRDASWLPYVQCAHARLGPGTKEATALLELATREHVFELGWLLEDRAMAGQPDWAQAHRAFGMGSPSQRVFLHVAMRLAGAPPEPPPAAYASFDDFAAVQAFLVETSLSPAGRRPR
jgi:hypothetical protein